MKSEILFQLLYLLFNCLIYSTTLLAESVVIIQPMPKAVRVGEPFTFAAQYKGKNITSFYCAGDWQKEPTFEKVSQEVVNGYLYLIYKCIKRGNGTFNGGWSPVDVDCNNKYFLLEVIPDYTGLHIMTEKGHDLLPEEYRPLETKKITVSAILNNGSGEYLKDVTSLATLTWSCSPNVSDFNISSSGNFTVPTSIKQRTVVTINATYSDGYVTRSASRTIVLLYSPVMVDITFNANGGEGGTSVTQESGSTFVAPTVTREGYTFIGWSPSLPSTVPSTDTTYTAQWQVNQYQMTFNANGGTGGKTLTLDYGSRLTAPVVARTGYTFTGWNPSLPATVPAEAKTFVAQWRINQYTQTFDANGGEGGAVVTQDYNTKLAAPSVTRDGFKFLRWEPEVPSMVPSENVTYVAQWDFQAPSWETPDNYQNNMTIYAQVKDTTKDALIESTGSLLAAFDSNGQCRGVASITTGPTGKLYQLTVCSNTAAGEALTLKIWNVSTG